MCWFTIKILEYSVLNLNAMCGGKCLICVGFKSTGTYEASYIWCFVALNQTNEGECKQNGRMVSEGLTGITYRDRILHGEIKARLSYTG